MLGIMLPIGVSFCFEDGYLYGYGCVPDSNLVELFAEI